MITLYQLPSAFGLPVSVSPFCTKLEAYLRLSGRDYEVATGRPNLSPTRRMPFVRFANGDLLAGSNAVISVLECDAITGIDVAANASVDGDLTPELRGRAERLRLLAEGPIYHGCLYARFVEAPGWRHQERLLKMLLPPVVAPVMLPLIRRAQRKRCGAHGIVSRESYERVLDAIEQTDDVLQDRPYVLDDRPRSVDCSVWAMLLHTAYSPADNPARYAVRQNRRLLDYIDRMSARIGVSLPKLPVAA